jgi:ADP-heptose:LPS heptosyltransferase/glycosyltransferase involved in cell wall biosynthesis
MLDFKSDFNFLHIGQWGPGGFGEDRKNISNLIKWFIEEFKGSKDVGLVLKVNMAKHSVIDKMAVENRIKQIKANYKEDEIPPIYLVHANLTNKELSALYNHPKIKAFISLTHGEGFGLPLLEAAACELPIIATNWSGHLDFLQKGLFSGVDYDLKPVPQAVVWKDIIIEGSQWADVSEKDAKHRMRKMTTSHTKPQLWAKDLVKFVQENFDVKVVCGKFLDTVKREYVKRHMQLNPLDMLKSIVDTPDSFNVVYTMPMSTGDVFISTAVLDGLVKSLPEDHKIYFATTEKYAQVLKNNPHVYKVIPWNDTMTNVDMLEKVFDLALTPNVATHYVFSNWVRRGQGRLLAEEYANHCQTELGNYFIDKDYTVYNDQCSKLSKYMTFHPTSGQGQWEARKYVEWKEVLKNLKDKYEGLKIVQVGSSDEPTFEEVDVDLRGKTDVNQLAAIVEKSVFHLTIDTFTMHLAAALGTPMVALFGSSHATSSGPWVPEERPKYTLLEAKYKLGCDKACYKYQCSKNADLPCVNEIDPKDVVEACSSYLDKELNPKPVFSYSRNYSKISGYTTTFNLNGYPYVESIKSMLGFCEEVVVLDGCSTDGTYETLEQLAKQDSRIKLYQNPWNYDEPGIDGLQKAFARTLCENEFLWQMDCDEVVHELDYEKIQLITKRFPKNADILHLPVIELWGNSEYVTGRRHAWKWRLSRNKPTITHGINKHALLKDEKTGKFYAKDGMSDGCEYIDVSTNEFIQHVGFWNEKLENARRYFPDHYAQLMNQAFTQLPSVYHYSWCSLENKVRNFRDKWDKQWNCLYLRDNIVRFPGVVTDEQIKETAQKLFEMGGEDSDQLKYKFKLLRSNPKVMENWLKSVPLNYEKDEVKKPKLEIVE